MKITLEPASHIYSDELGQEYKSVTRFINQFVPHFDFEQKSKNYAAKYGMNVEEVRESWTQKNKDSTDFGTKIHSLIENYINKKTIEPSTFFIPVKNIVDELFNCFSGIFITESVIYDSHRKIAGTSDLIVDDGSRFSIVDFKTNKQIKYTNDFEDKFLLKPISHLPNSEYFKYSLQLSFYAYFYKNITGKNVDRLCFYWLKRSKAENYTDLSRSKWLRYNVPYLKEEVESCLNHAF
jgi:ATP-dependent exoDNAse (exonuclease V) beta subunit